MHYKCIGRYKKKSYYDITSQPIPIYYNVQQAINDCDFWIKLCYYTVQMTWTIDTLKQGSNVFI